MTEKCFENKIKSFIKLRGGYVLKTFGNGYQMTGTPDLLCSVRGVFVAIEVKSDTGKANELQIQRLKDIEQTGGIGIVAYPCDWEHLQVLLNGLFDVIPLNNDFNTAKENLKKYFKTKGKFYVREKKSKNTV